MLLTDTSKERARLLGGVATGLSAAVALAAYFGLNDGGLTLILPVIACAAATAWPTRIVVGTAMTATAAVVVLGLEDTGVLFGASVAALMLSLNNLQSAATRIRRRKPSGQPG
jgi:hypothetical protein